HRRPTPVTGHSSCPSRRRPARRTPRRHPAHLARHPHRPGPRRHPHPDGTAMTLLTLHLRSRRAGWATLLILITALLRRILLPRPVRHPGLTAAHRRLGNRHRRRHGQPLRGNRTLHRRTTPTTSTHPTRRHQPDRRSRIHRGSHHRRPVHHRIPARPDRPHRH